MFRDGLLDKILRSIKKFIPRSIFDFFAPTYHTLLAYGGALLYGFPSHSLKIIAVTGTKGKSTVVYLITKMLEDALQSDDGGPAPVAAIGSLGFKIKDKEWPNTLKMTMPGRMKLQKFLYNAKKAKCKYVVLEVTSEGIRQKRHLGTRFDCAVFTNIHPEHIETHGSFELYMASKQELFRKTKNIHVVNADDSHTKKFGEFPAKRKMFFGLKQGDLCVTNLNVSSRGATFEIYGTRFETRLAGRFGVLNCLAALSVGAMYGLDLPTMSKTLREIKEIPGRMQFIQTEPFTVVVDYAHTPDSLELVYKMLHDEVKKKKLICVLGAAGGGRDKWKRPKFGELAERYCDKIILTDEDPYDEDPQQILSQIKSGMKNKASQSTGRASPNQIGRELRIEEILDRREAIRKAILSAQKGDIVIITGKGSETSMALKSGKKIPWSDTGIVRKVLAEKSV